MTFGPLSTVTYAVNGVSFDMVRIPPGRLMNGEGRTRRELLVSRPFELGVTPVTQALWLAVTGLSPARFKCEDRPVEQVSHHDVQAFLFRLSALGLTGFRLPTEAEWSWAARCGAPTRWAGADRSKAVAVVESSQTAVIAVLSSSAVGALDLSGNVYEWVCDWHEWLPLAGVDVQGPVVGSSRVLQGGGWSLAPSYARVALRDYDTPGFRSSSLGFRLLRTAG